jgi:hypothetical protein
MVMVGVVVEDAVEDVEDAVVAVVEDAEDTVVIIKNFASE